MTFMLIKRLNFNLHIIQTQVVSAKDIKLIMESFGNQNSICKVKQMDRSRINIWIKTFSKSLR